MWRQVYFFFIVFLSRLSPVFPFPLVSYALGVCNVPLSSYTLATFLGLLPGCAAYCYMGESIGTAASQEGPGESSVGLWVSIAGTIASIGAISWKANQILNSADTNVRED